VPKVSIAVLVRTGNLNEGEHTWLADVTGELMREGTATLDGRARAHGRAHGRSIGVAVGADQTSIGADVLSEFGPIWCSSSPTSPSRRACPSRAAAHQADFQRSLAIAHATAESGERGARGVLYGDHPYGHSFPTEAQLAAYSIDDVRAYHSANFGAARTEVLVVGKFDRAAMRAAIEHAFGQWPRGPERLIDIPKMNDKPALRLIARPGAPQATIYLVLPVIDPSQPGYTKLAVTNMLLGGFFFASRATCARTRATPTRLRAASALTTGPLTGRRPPT
jgi:predicted Zn-dependent peptidase